jgi:DNA modification methylase
MRIETIGNATLYLGDCLDVLKTLPTNSVDSVVCDPPYGLSFMGKKWDYDVPSVEIWAECLRVLKPGGHLLAFAGTRTQHRMAVRIEDAGFEIRDMIAWVYGSGFPKSHNVGKSIDREAGAQREVVGKAAAGSAPLKRGHVNTSGGGLSVGTERSPEYDITAPATEAARQWQGWGTALKPALEPITMARKPFASTVAANVLAHGTGALNIDGCRVWTDDGANRARPPRTANAILGGGRGTNLTASEHNDAGRWPANLIHDGSEEVVAGFPVTKSGALTAAQQVKGGFAGTVNAYGTAATGGTNEYMASEGSAARFFMQCKGDYNDAWQDLNLPQENANTAEQSSSQQRQAAVSALVLAVSSALPEGLLCSGLSMAPFTSATANELRLIAETATQTIQTIGSKFWRESKPARLSLSLNHASDAEIQRLTDTTTITVSRWKSDGSAEPVTFSITPMSLEVGGKACAPSMDGKRFIYCAKASKADRDEGLDGMPVQARHTMSGGECIAEGRTAAKGKASARNHHPTVKPTDLMAYLCRLVTPPGGVVLDPFMGSGSTGKAAIPEGFHFIGVECEPAYFDIACRRIEQAHAQGQLFEPTQAAPVQLDLAVPSTEKEAA